MKKINELTFDIKIAEDTIREEAYKLWETSGRPYGSDWHFWFEAEYKLNEILNKIDGISFLYRGEWYSLLPH